MTFVLLTAHPHRLLQPAERRSVPDEFTAQSEQKAPLHGLELSPQDPQRVIHVRMVAARYDDSAPSNLFRHATLVIYGHANLALEDAAPEVDQSF